MQSWILRTGSPWRDLPPARGLEEHARRFSRWRDKGIWGKLSEQLVDDVDSEWLMIDASHIKVPPSAAGVVGEGGHTKLHLAVDEFGVHLRVIITSGTVADYTQAGKLIEGIAQKHLLADRGYDTPTKSSP